MRGEIVLERPGAKPIRLERGNAPGETPLEAERVRVVLREHEAYDGEYAVEPRFRGQTLATRDRLLAEDLVVNPIRIADTSNAAGGVTIYIGAD